MFGGAVSDVSLNSSLPPLGNTYLHSRTQGGGVGKKGTLNGHVCTREKDTQPDGHAQRLCLSPLSSAVVPPHNV